MDDIATSSMHPAQAIPNFNLPLSQCSNFINSNQGDDEAHHQSKEEEDTALHDDDDVTQLGH